MDVAARTTSGWTTSGSVYAAAPVGPDTETRRFLVSEQTTYEVTLQDQHLRRNGEAVEQLRRMHLGRFSEGVEQLPETPRKLHVGRFSEGVEQLPETPGKLHVGHFSEGVEQL